ncbi:helix-turn-helix domain-containing protein [Halorussus salinisoli]|uniref:helix-turn-helix domain-containing protein n=1 Tax=Halorussus salinisoli TaxID=2558242 RepID=UPI0010C1E862|nr:helix-turn-helix domain-containing protein [Halorussus salinisoli]
MATIAEFTVPADDFPLGHIFETLPDVTIEIERVVPTNRGVLPYFWVRNVPTERVRETLEAQGALESFAIVDELDSQGLVRADWDPNVEGVFTGIVDAELTLLSATGTQEEWRFEFRAEDTDQIVAFQQYCTDLDIDVELVRLYDVGETGSTGQYSLTPEQREALLLAYNNGYYDFPRQVDLETLAEELAIARQSFADRLRRGHRNLIGETVARQ